MFDQLTAACTAVSQGYDPSEMSPTQLERALEELGPIKAMVDGIVARTAHAAEKAHAHLLNGDRNAASMVARTLGTSTGEAKSAIDTAQKLESLPATDAAVRRGELSAKQAQLIADAATANPAAEAELLETAARGLSPLRDACAAAKARVEDPAERSARQHKLRSFRSWVDDDGMVAGRFRLTPEVGGPFVKRIEAEVQRIFRSKRSGEDHDPHEAYAADALVKTGGGKANYTVHVSIDHGVLKRGNVLEGEQCEIPGVGPVNVEWVRSILGEAFLTSIIKDGKDIKTITHHGRHIPAMLMTALIASGYECKIVDCPCRGYLEIDHVKEFAKGGPTAFWNLVWLCYVHHRRKTQGWTLGPPDPKTGKRKLRPPPARAA